MRASTSASQACGSTLLRLAVWISVYITAAHSPPRSEPANSHALLVRQMRPSSRKRVKASHRLGGFGVPRQPRALGSHPGFEVGDERRCALRANRAALGGRKAIDLAFDIEDRLNALHAAERRACRPELRR